MKAFLIAVCSAMILSFSALPASAELLFSLSVDMPISYDFDSAELNDADPSGFKVLLSLPFFLGVGYEDYTIDLKGGSPNPVDARFELTFYDLFFTIPVIGLTVGAGVGKGTLDTLPAVALFEESSMKQIFVQYGIDLALGIDIHLAYHVISGEATPTNPADNVLDLGAKMWTAGIKIGF